MTKENKIRYSMLWMFFAYFIVLIGERLYSFIASLAGGMKIYQGKFNIMVYGTVIISFIAFVVYLIVFCRPHIKALFKPSDEVLEKLDFTRIAIAAGIILLAGMVHTEYTIAPIQFVSYGFYIVALLLQTIINQTHGARKIVLWFSFVYLVLFSMAIPVAYHAVTIEHKTIFHALEGIAAYLLVASFLCMTIMLYKGKDSLFHPSFIIAALVLDIPLIVLRWSEEINFFVMIFLALAAVTYIPGLILSIKQKK